MIWSAVQESSLVFVARKSASTTRIMARGDKFLNHIDEIEISRENWKVPMASFPYVIFPYGNLFPMVIFHLVDLSPVAMFPLW